LVSCTETSRESKSESRRASEGGRGLALGEANPATTSSRGSRASQSWRTRRRPRRADPQREPKMAFKANRAGRGLWGGRSPAITPSPRGCPETAEEARNETDQGIQGAQRPGAARSNSSDQNAKEKPTDQPKTLTSPDTRSRFPGHRGLNPLRELNTEPAELNPVAAGQVAATQNGGSDSPASPLRRARTFAVDVTRSLPRCVVESPSAASTPSSCLTKIDNHQTRKVDLRASIACPLPDRRSNPLPPPDLPILFIKSDDPHEMRLIELLY
jgi:hypothetical protein